MANVVTEALISKIVKRWRDRLGLGSDWSIRIKLHDADEWPDGHDGEVAFVDASPGYFDAVLHVYQWAAEVDEDPLELIILHELVHIVLWPMWIVVRDTLGAQFPNTADDMNEAAVEQVTRALLATARSRK